MPDINERHGWPEQLTPNFECREIVPAMIVLRERFTQDNMIQKILADAAAVPFVGKGRKHREAKESARWAMEAWFNAQPEEAECKAQEADAIRHASEGHSKRVCPDCGNVLWGRHESGYTELVARDDSKGYDGGGYSNFRLLEGTPCDCTAKKDRDAQAIRFAQANEAEKAWFALPQFDGEGWVVCYPGHPYHAADVPETARLKETDSRGRVWVTLKPGDDVIVVPADEFAVAVRAAERDV